MSDVMEKFRSILRRIPKKFKRFLVNDLSDEILLEIFKRCNPVTINYCQFVCKRWNRVLKQLDDIYFEPFKSVGHFRLYICDRRRAILERFVDQRFGGRCKTTAIRDIIAVRKTVYVNDCVAKPQEDCTWDYQFDFTHWTENYPIVEVCLQNFGAFLERDKEAVRYLSVSKSIRHDSNERTDISLPLSANSQRRCTWNSRTSLSCSSDCDTESQVGSKMKFKRSSGSIQSVDDYMFVNKAFEKMSAGRFECLASKLCRIKQPLHVVFDDQALYQIRPTMLLFWFLRKLEIVRKITFNCVQGMDIVELHEVLTLDEIDELNVIQPTQDACLTINASLLCGFLRIRKEKRRKFRLRFTGHTNITASSLIDFIVEWQNHNDVVKFYTVLVDAMTVSPDEFVIYCANLEESISPQKERSGIRAKYSGNFRRMILVFDHQKHSFSIKYRYEDGYLLFLFFDPNEPESVKNKQIDPRNIKSKIDSFRSNANTTHRNDHIEVKCAVTKGRNEIRASASFAKIFSRINLSLEKNF